jgi:hypothetical protein
MIGGNPTFVMESYDEITAIFADKGADSFVVLTLEGGQPITLRTSAIDAVYKSPAP